MKRMILNTCLLALLILLHGISYAAPADQEYSKANKLFAKGKYAQALVIYENLLSDPYCAVPTGVLHTRIADSYFQLEDYVSARQAYRNALQVQKESERPSIQYWIGFCTFLQGNNEEAVEEFLKIPRLYSDSGMWVGTAYYWVGRVYERMGKKELAAEYFRKAAGNGKSTEGAFALKKAEKLKDNQHLK